MEQSNPSVAALVLASAALLAAPVESSYRHASIDVDGVEAHYIEAGEGEPFLLIHGGLAWSSGEANYAELSEHFRVIAPDVIGFGRTAPRGARDYSGQAQGDFLIGFIEALGLVPVSLTGNSHGGFLAQYIAHKRPDLVCRLVITNSLNGTVPIPSLPEGGGYIYAAGGHQYQAMTKDEIHTMLLSYYQHRELVTEARVDLVVDNYQRNWEYAHARGTAVSSSVDVLNRNLSYEGKHISERAKELQMPVLLMWSEPGSKIEWGLAHFLAVPGAEMHLLPWSGHHLFTDQSARWAQVVTDWLTNDPARPPGCKRARAQGDGRSPPLHSMSTASRRTTSRWGRALPSFSFTAAARRPPARPTTTTSSSHSVSTFMSSLPTLSASATPREEPDTTRARHRAITSRASSRRSTWGPSFSTGIRTVDFWFNTSP